MWNLLGYLGGSTGLSFLNSALQQSADSKAYKRQVNLMKMQQKYNTKMANTAHQRQVKDLRSAGLNPILSATGGNGAPSPVTSAPSVSQGSRQDFFGMSDFVDALKVGAELDVAENTGKKLKADSDVAGATVDKINAETEGIRLENEIKEKGLRGPRTVEKFTDKVTEKGFWSDVNEGIWRWLDTLNPAGSAYGHKQHERRVQQQLHKNHQDHLWNEVQKYRKENPGFEFSKKGEIIYSHPKKKIEYNKIRMRSNEELDREFKKLKRRKK